ncbi:MAG: hypothetical protein IPL40_04645 [Proteobacteria bacterium]|nr:hypothetical protein [Pseudomonadota bacterium]
MPSPWLDREAVQAARDVCRGLPRAGPPSPRLLEFALRTRGLIEPLPDVVVGDWLATGTEHAAEALRERLAGLLKRTRYARAGVAVCRSLLRPERRRVVALLLESAVRLEPVPRQAALGQRLRLRFLRRQPGPALALTVTFPDGSVRGLPLQVRQGGYDALVTCEARGRYRIEISGEGPYGDEVLANFPLDCAAAPPTTLELPPSAPTLGAGPSTGLSTGPSTGLSTGPSTGLSTGLSTGPAGSTAEQLEAELSLLTATLRSRSGRAALEPDATLAGVARRHAEDMLAQGYLGHRAPRFGGPVERLRRAGLACAVLRENVARGYAVDELLHALAESPAHRANLLAEDVTTLGSGLAIDREAQPPVLFVAQLFAGGPCTRVTPTPAASTPVAPTR